MFSYKMPTEIFFGKDCLQHFSRLLASRPGARTLIITGKNSAKLSGALEEVRARMGWLDTATFQGVESNPTIESLKKGLDICRKERIDFIISIGGGSVIDYGKAVSILSCEKKDIRDFFYKKRKLKGCKISFAAVPTTFGSSSEITPYAVISCADIGGKITLSDDRMFPDYSFIDPMFSLSMPKNEISSSCADLLSHAVESYWSVNATVFTDCLAECAIKLFLMHYKKTFSSPRSFAVREQMSLSALYAGLAFSNTRTTACHSISYPMTTIFNIPHGVACILTLAEMLEFNSKDPFGNKIMKLSRIMGCDTVGEAKRKIETVLRELKIKARLRDYGLGKKDLQVIADKGFTPERVLNNPRRLKKKDMAEMLERIY